MAARSLKAMTRVEGTQSLHLSCKASAHGSEMSESLQRG